MGLLITLRNVTSFLISSMVLGLLDQVQTFSQLYLIELPWLLIGLGLLKLLHLIYSRLLTGRVMLVFFTEANLIAFQVGCLALFCLFSDVFGWFWIRSLRKSIQSRLKLMTFLMTLSVILLSMLIF